MGAPGAVALDTTDGRVVCKEALAYWFEAMCVMLIATCGLSIWALAARRRAFLSFSCSMSASICWSSESGACGATWGAVRAEGSWPRSCVENAGCWGVDRVGASSC